VALDPLARAPEPTRHVGGVKQRRILAEQLDHAAGDLLDLLVGDENYGESPGLDAERLVDEIGEAAQ
jgi:hypothetical protein